MYKIGIWFEKFAYEYDVQTIVMAFYPSADLSLHYEDDFSVQAYDLALRVCYPPGKALLCFYGAVFDERSRDLAEDEEPVAVRDWLKQTIYQVLSAATGQKLPWGTLTGIRPTRLALTMLEEGQTDAEIAAGLGERYYVSPAKSALAIDIANRERALLQEFDYENGYSLYVGIPFCPSICLYCSFSSNPLSRWEKRVDEYLDTLCYEIRQTANLLRGRHLDTIYIGGGTPTTLGPGQLARLLNCLEENFIPDDRREFTVEAGRPDSITPQKLQVLRSFGVERISVNPQTMHQETLDLIGRRHTVEDTRRAFYEAREAGFTDINMDLIVGLPGEDAAKVRDSLEQILELAPDNLTIHSLALKRAARLSLFRDQYEPISFQNSSEIMDMTMAYAQKMGMTPYYMYRQKHMAGNFENVGYARPGKACLYNILMMEEKQPVLALGAGGSTKLVYNHGQNIKRVENVKDLYHYFARIDEMIARKRNGIEQYLGGITHAGGSDCKAGSG